MTIKFEDLTAGERKLLGLCVHEGSHAVLGVVAGGVLRSASVYGNRVTPGRPGTMNNSGLTLFDFVPQGREPEVAFAGPYAQARWLAGKRPSMREVNASFDGGGCRDKEHLRGAAMSQASVIVPTIENVWPSIETVAKLLHRTGKATHPDVCKALGVTDGGGPGSTELSLIRGGAVPGSFRVTRAVA